MKYYEQNILRTYYVYVHWTLRIDIMHYIARTYVRMEKFANVQYIRTTALLAAFFDRFKHFE